MANQLKQSQERLEQAAQIVVDEVVSLERRIRAFSEFSSEPPIAPKSIDINSLLEERIALLKAAHPEVVYDTRLAPDCRRRLGGTLVLRYTVKRHRG